MQSPPGTLTQQTKKTSRWLTSSDSRFANRYYRKGHGIGQITVCPAQPSLILLIRSSVQVCLSIGRMRTGSSQQGWHPVKVPACGKDRACRPSGLKLDLPKGVVPMPSFFACYYTRGRHGRNVPKKGGWVLDSEAGSGHWLLCSVMARLARVSARPDHPP